MVFKAIHKLLNLLIYLVFGLFGVVLLVRFLLTLIGVNLETPVFKVFYWFSDLIYRLFDGTYRSYSADILTIDLNLIVAITVLFSVAMLCLKIVSLVSSGTLWQKVCGTISIVFRIVELMISFRLIFKITGALTSTFMSFIFASTAPFYNIADGIFKPVTKGAMVFEISTLVSLIIISAIDFIINEIFKQLAIKSTENYQVAEALNNKVDNSKRENSSGTNIYYPNNSQIAELGPISGVQQVTNFQPVSNTISNANVVTPQLSTNNLTAVRVNQAQQSSQPGIQQAPLSSPTDPLPGSTDPLPSPTDPLPENPFRTHN